MVLNWCHFIQVISMKETQQKVYKCYLKSSTLGLFVEWPACSLASHTACFYTKICSLGLAVISQKFQWTFFFCTTANQIKEYKSNSSKMRHKFALSDIDSARTLLLFAYFKVNLPFKSSYGKEWKGVTCQLYEMFRGADFVAFDCYPKSRKCNPALRKY